MGLLILQEIAPTEKTVLFEATMTSGYYKNAETNGEGYRYDITVSGCIKWICTRSGLSSMTDCTKKVRRKSDFIS